MTKWIALAARAARRHVLWLIPAAVCLVLIAPMAFTDRTFAPDWTDHVWLVWQQKLNLLDLGAPSYFLQTTSLGAYYPFYAFYGGTLYVIGGLLAMLTGSVASVVLLYFAAFAIAYIGWTWLSMQAGLRGWVAYLPGAIAVTCPYAVTVAYGRGDLAETVATSMIPLVLAAGLSIFRADRLRASVVAAYVSGVAILTGAHTLTLLWGGSFLLAGALIAALCWRDLVRRRARRLLELMGLSLLGLAINAWTLGPLAAYSHDTAIGQNPKPLAQTNFTQAGELFRPFRSTPQVSDLAANVEAQLPVLVLLFVLLLGAFAWRGMTRERRLFAAGLAGLFGITLVLIPSPSLIEDLPRVWRFIQFPYRLLTYADLIALGLLILVLAGLRARPRLFRWATVAVAAIAVVSTGQALAQSLAVPSWLTIVDHTTAHGREAAFISPTNPPLAWYAVGDFADASEPVVRPTLPSSLNTPIEDSRRLDYQVSYPPGPAGTVVTNATGGPNLVAVEGARVAGRTRDHSMVLRLPASNMPRIVRFSPRESTPIVAGQVISLIALVAAFGLVAGLAVRDRRARRNQASRPAPSAA
jgi:hypothetical protein